MYWYYRQFHAWHTLSFFIKLTILKIRKYVTENDLTLIVYGASSQEEHCSIIIFVELELRSRSRLWTGPRFNIKITSYQYRKSHCGDKTILRPSYLHNGISYTGKMTSLYWIRALDPITWPVNIHLRCTKGEWSSILWNAGLILVMSPANVRQHYSVILKSAMKCVPISATTLITLVSTFPTSTHKW